MEVISESRPDTDGQIHPLSMTSVLARMYVNVQRISGMRKCAHRWCIWKRLKQRWIVVHPIGVIIRFDQTPLVLHTACDHGLFPHFQFEIRQRILTRKGMRRTACQLDALALV